MILCIDIGNTNVVTAIWDGKSYIDENRIESISGVKGRLSHIDFDQINKVILSSVVPKLTEEYTFEINGHSQINPFVIGCASIINSLTNKTKAKVIIAT